MTREQSAEGTNAASNEAAALALDFEAWATLLARCSDRDANGRRQVLAEANIDDGTWARSTAHNKALLESDLRRGQLGKAMIVRAKRVAEQKRRAEAPIAPVRVESIEANRPTAGPASLSVAMSGEHPISAPLPIPAPDAVPQSTRRSVSTLTLDEKTGPKPPSLPFRVGPAWLPSKDDAPRASAARSLGETRSAVEPATEAPLPFTVGEPGVDMTIEQYASFRAELGVHPEREAQTLARYGVAGAKARREVDERWRKRFATDRGAQRRFLELSTQYRDWLIAQKRAR